MNQALENIRRRVDAFGVAEPDIFVTGNNIEVQIPGPCRGNGPGASRRPDLPGRRGRPQLRVLRDHRRGRGGARRLRGQGTPRTVLPHRERRGVRVPREREERAGGPRRDHRAGARGAVMRPRRQRRQPSLLRHQGGGGCVRRRPADRAPQHHLPPQRPGRGRAVLLLDRSSRRPARLDPAEGDQPTVLRRLLGRAGARMLPDAGEGTGASAGDRAGTADPVDRNHRASRGARGPRDDPHHEVPPTSRRRSRCATLAQRETRVVFLRCAGRP